MNELMMRKYVAAHGLPAELLAALRHDNAEIERLRDSEHFRSMVVDTLTDEFEWDINDADGDGSTADVLGWIVSGVAEMQAEIERLKAERDELREYQLAILDLVDKHKHRGNVIEALKQLDAENGALREQVRWMTKILDEQHVTFPTDQQFISRDWRAQAKIDGIPIPADDQGKQTRTRIPDHVTSVRSAYDEEDNSNE